MVGHDEQRAFRWWTITRDQEAVTQLGADPAAPGMQPPHAYELIELENLLGEALGCWTAGEFDQTAQRCTWAKPQSRADIADIEPGQVGEWVVGVAC